jgi:hypothetical protein
MGKCKICGESAGWFKEYHEECKTKYKAGLDKLVSVATKAVLDLSLCDSLMNTCRSIAQMCRISDENIRDALIVAWENALDKYLDDGVLSTDEENQLMTYANKFSLDQSELDRKGQFTRAAQAGVLRDIVEGKIPERVTVTGSVPFNLQKNESLVWLFNSVSLLEEKTTRSYVGGYQGMSIKVMKGVYYRVGAFKGHPVESTQMVNKGYGSLGVTTKNIYFAGSQKSLRVPYNKVITFIPYSDGIGIHTDAKTAKPIAFITGDGWFINNLVQNLAQM